MWGGGKCVDLVPDIVQLFSRQCMEYIKATLITRSHKVNHWIKIPPFYLAWPSPHAFSTGNHKTNRVGSNSLNRQALTGIDQCSDGGMRVSHVFSIIHTALLFPSPPLRQVSILLRRNQSGVCQTLSILRLICVSHCGWLHASVASRTGRQTLCARALHRLEIK